MKAQITNQEEIRKTRWDPEAVQGFIFVLPVVGLLGLTRVIPAIWALYVSFTKYSVIQPPEWIGLANYIEIFRNPLFFKAFSNTLIYTLGTTIPSTLIALAVAIMLNQRIRGLALFRAAYFTPVVVSWVSISMIWMYILNPTFGVLNYLLSFANIPKLSWLATVPLAMISVIFIGTWKNLGYNIIIYLAGLQSIPRELDEAAMVDGARGWFLFRRITWPILLPTTIFILLITGIASFQAFDHIYILTSGGPAKSTTTVVTEIYFNAFKYFKMGYAAAMAFVLFVVTMVLSLILLRLRRREIGN